MMFAYGVFIVFNMADHNLLLEKLPHYGIYVIVGRRVHAPPPFSKIPPFLEIQDVPTFYKLIKKIKVLKNSFNKFVYNFNPQSILILEEYLQKW